MTEQSNNEEVLGFIREAKEQHLTELNLSDCLLTELPKELLELSWLERLDLHINQIVDIQPLVSLSNLTKLDLSNNKIVDIKLLKKLLKKGTPIYFITVNNRNFPNIIYRTIDSDKILVSNNPLQHPPLPLS
ncbi:leucine-rich repeat domain-containing protein [Thiothrix litoralis]|jgi:Leucine-rich repeat (LRR) protein|uniref:Leucine-rich repeat domain-containing protein n=1 Tax=Thiothrix litoralis TaxID=2891210 RepID=A0ABX7WTS0_9GAMM|nr:leucine-rich repeat domain-containing protein [Thiothrix litoralis]QTR47231.1 leucine-rich repeat domain-containing protein [Thiothrix litoralis]